MPRNPRHDVLFEPVKIGPLIARNLFFQVPHCNGMGYAKPRSHAAMRGIKAEGGWAVVSTEEVEIHPSSDLSPYIEGRLWDDSDIPCLEMMSRAMHEHGALAAIELREGFQEDFVRFVKTVTSKPVVGVGRFTSPDTMAAQIRRGILDFIGAARPSIADPFLPQKIADGDIDDIRECIGCNVCVTGDHTMTPIRCTQNPTMGEEWRKGWHPERIRARESEKPVLIIGGGPAGLEAAHALGKRGYEVALAEAGTELGGRVTREAKLPGLAAWARVRDYRLLQLHKLPNVQTYLASRLCTAEVLEFGYPRIVIATGAKWRRDGVGHQHTSPLPIAPGAVVVTPDDIMDGAYPAGTRVVVWDDDHYYMGGVMAEALAAKGYQVTYATPASEASTWTRNTMEQHFIQKRLLEAGVEIIVSHTLTAIAPDHAVLDCVFTGRQKILEVDAVLPVTARLPEETLLHELRAADLAAAGIESVTAIGDALAPATIAHAIYAGRRYAEELDATLLPPDTLPFRREITELL